MLPKDGPGYHNLGSTSSDDGDSCDILLDLSNDTSRHCTDRSNGVDAAHVIEDSTLNGAHEDLFVINKSFDVEDELVTSLTDLKFHESLHLKMGVATSNGICTVNESIPIDIPAGISGSLRTGQADTDSANRCISVRIDEPCEINEKHFRLIPQSHAPPLSDFEMQPIQKRLPGEASGMCLRDGGQAESAWRSNSVGPVLERGGTHTTTL